MEEAERPVDDATMRRWAELALTVRSYGQVISTVSTPRPGTAFATADAMYPTESISQWCREGMRSALDHLGLWADHAVPLQQYEGQVVRHGGFRWAFTLMRGGIEGAAQSLWLSGSASLPEALARLVRMVRHDLAEEAKAMEAMGRDSSHPRGRLLGHEKAAGLLTEHGKNTPHLPAMVDLVKSAATDAGFSQGKYEGHWRVCSAAAHGKDWAVRELQMLTGEPYEWRPGQFHFQGYVDPAKLTEILSDTLDLVAVALHRYLARAYDGDVKALLQRSIYEAAKLTPQMDDGTHIRRVAAEMGIEDDA